MTITATELGRRLQEARESWKLTQTEVAESLDVPRSAVSEMEAGRRGVSALELHRLARLYGRAMADFLEPDFGQDEATAGLLRRHPEVALCRETMESLRRCAALRRETANLQRKLGYSHGSIGLPAYPGPPAGSRWAAVEQGSAVATAERHRLGLGSRPLPDLAGLLESQGVQTTLIPLPHDVSGLALMDDRTGFLVAVNGSHPVVRRRFSFAREYAHVLFDRRAKGLVSRVGERNDLREVRANAFATSFLMPEVAVRAFVASLSKGRASRLRTDIYDEHTPLQVTARSKPRSQELQLHDVVLLVHHFAVSCPAAHYRLKSLGLIDERERLALADQHRSGLSRRLRRFFKLSEPDDSGGSEQFQSRFLHLALDAYRQEYITRCKLEELVQLATMDGTEKLADVLEG